MKQAPDWPVRSKDLIGRFEASVGDISDGEGFVIGFLRRNDRGVRGQRKMNPGVGHLIV